MWVGRGKRSEPIQARRASEWFVCATAASLADKKQKCCPFGSNHSLALRACIAPILTAKPVNTSTTRKRVSWFSNRQLYHDRNVQSDSLACDLALRACTYFNPALLNREYKPDARASGSSTQRRNLSLTKKQKMSSNTQSNHSVPQLLQRQGSLLPQPNQLFADIIQSFHGDLHVLGTILS